MPPSAAAANGPTCSQRRALPKRTTSSTASGVATPLSTIQSASRRSACCSRFQMKPGTSRCTSTGRLPQLATAARASSTASGRLCGARDHLDERHQQRRVPVVGADGALGRAAGIADRADRERGGVAGDHGVREVRGDRRQHLALERQILRHRLDDQVAALDRVQRVGHRHLGRGAHRHLLGAEAELQHGRERLLDAGPGGLGSACVALHAVAAECVLGRDLRAHQPGTYDDDIHQPRS